MSSLPAGGALSSRARTMSASDETEVVVDRPGCKEGLLVVSPLILLWRYKTAASSSAETTTSSKQNTVDVGQSGCFL